MADFDTIEVSHWLSLGYSEPYAEAIYVLQLNLQIEVLRLKMLTSRLEGGEQGVKADAIVIRAGGTVRDLPEGLLIPDDSLLPLWTRFAEEVASFATSQVGHGRHLDVTIAHVRLTHKVLDILGPAVETGCLERFTLHNNRIDCDGIAFVAGLLDANPSLHVLCLSRNEIDLSNGHESTSSLADAVKRHTGLKMMDLRTGSLLCEELVMTSMFALYQVNLKNVGLATKEASLISNALAANPAIKMLDVDGNRFNDGDATLLSNALRSNTNLWELCLRDNNFTDAGIKSLMNCIFDDSNLNAILECNGVCDLQLFAEGTPMPKDIDSSVLSLNHRLIKPSEVPDSAFTKFMRTAGADADKITQMFLIESSRKRKILYSLQGRNAGVLDMSFLNNVPLELLPNLLICLREAGIYSAKQDTTCDAYFQLVRSRPDFFFGVVSKKKKARWRHHFSVIAVAAAIAFALLSRSGCCVSLKHSG